MLFIHFYRPGRLKLATLDKKVRAVAGKPDNKYDVELCPFILMLLALTCLIISAVNGLLVLPG